MKNKRFKITITTISVAGYIGKKKVTNTINWRVCCVDEKDKDIDEIIANETQNILSSLKESYQSTALELSAKTTTENHYVDTFRGMTERALKKR